MSTKFKLIITHKRNKPMSYKDSQEFKDILRRISENDPSLTNLDLSYNDLGSEGAKHLSEALKENTTLTNLDLSSNNLGSEPVA